MRDLVTNRQPFFRDAIGEQTIFDLFGPQVVPIRPVFDRGDILFTYLRSAAEDGCVELDWCEKYGEPGYTDPKRGILLSNWNYFPRWFNDALEKAGYALEWSDEWTIDWEGGQKAYRTQGDSYSWEPSLIYTDDGVLTRDDEPSAIIDYCAIDHPCSPGQCVPSWISDLDLREAGFEPEGERYENGWHPGQTDDPKVIAERAFKFGARRVVFRKVENSQFYIRFECYIEKETEDA